MTKNKLRAYIQKDLRKLAKERGDLLPEIKHRNDTKVYRLDYLITRQHTLKEILSLI